MSDCLKVQSCKALERVENLLRDRGYALRERVGDYAYKQYLRSYQPLMQKVVDSLQARLHRHTIKVESIMGSIFVTATSPNGRTRKLNDPDHKGCGQNYRLLSEIFSERLPEVDVLVEAILHVESLLDIAIEPFYATGRGNDNA